MTLDAPEKQEAGPFLSPALNPSCGSHLGSAAFESSGKSVVFYLGDRPGLENPRDADILFVIGERV